MNKKEWKKWMFWFSLALVLIIIYKAIDSVQVVFEAIGNFIDIVKPFLAAILLALLLYKPCVKVEKAFNSTKSKFLNKHAKGLAILLVYLIVLLILFITINSIAPLVSKNVVELAKNIPGYLKSGIEFTSSQDESSIWKRLSVDQLLINIQNTDYQQIILEWATFDNLGNIVKGISGATGFIFSIFVTLVVSIYTISERHDIKKFLKRATSAMFSEKTYNKIAHYYGEIYNIFYNFLAGQLFDALIVGIGSIIILSILNIKYGVLLGLFIGLFNIIPYFGAIISIVITILITIFTANPQTAILIGIILTVFQQIDANVINPKIIGSTLKLSPILVIFAVTVGGAYFNVLGMFLGVPIVGLLKIIIEDSIDEKIKQKEELKQQKS